MNIATKLTVARIAIIPFFMTAFLYKAPGESLVNDWGKIIATSLFIIAAITDYYDGYLARKYQLITTLGKFMDPVADKLLVSAALIAMVEYHEVTFTYAWIAIVIIAREFSVTGLRLVCAEQGQIIDASSAGKLKTITQLVAIIATMCLLSLRICFTTYAQKEALDFLMQYYSTAIQTLMIIAVISTVYSGYDYFKKNWHFLN